MGKEMPSSSTSSCSIDGRVGLHLLDSLLLRKDFNATRYALRCILHPMSSSLNLIEKERNAEEDEEMLEYEKELHQHQQKIEACIEQVAKENHAELNEALLKLRKVHVCFDSANDAITNFSRRIEGAKGLLKQHDRIINAQAILHEKLVSEKVLAMIQDIETIQSASCKIHAWMEKKSFVQAVECLNQTLHLLFTPQMIELDAFTHIRDNLMETKQNLEESLITELLSMVYMRPVFHQHFITHVPEHVHEIDDAAALLYPAIHSRADALHEQYFGQNEPSLRYSMECRESPSTTVAKEMLKSSQASGCSSFSYLEELIRALHKLNRLTDALSRMKATMDQEISELLIQITSLFHSCTPSTLDHQQGEDISSFTMQSISDGTKGWPRIIPDTLLRSSRDFEALCGLLFRMLKQLLRRHWLVLFASCQEVDGSEKGDTNIQHFKDACTNDLHETRPSEADLITGMTRETILSLPKSKWTNALPAMKKDPSLFSFPYTMQDVISKMEFAMQNFMMHYLDDSDMSETIQKHTRNHRQASHSFQAQRTKLPTSTLFQFRTQAEPSQSISTWTIINANQQKTRTERPSEQIPKARRVKKTCTLDAGSGSNMSSSLMKPTPYWALLFYQPVFAFFNQVHRSYDKQVASKCSVSTSMAKFVLSCTAATRSEENGKMQRFLDDFVQHLLLARVKLDVENQLNACFQAFHPEPKGVEEGEGAAQRSKMKAKKGFQSIEMKHGEALVQCASELAFCAQRVPKFVSFFVELLGKLMSSWMNEMHQLYRRFTAGTQASRLVDDAVRKQMFQELELGVHQDQNQDQPTASTSTSTLLFHHEHAQEKWITFLKWQMEQDQAFLQVDHWNDVQRNAKECSSSLLAALTSLECMARMRCTHSFLVHGMEKAMTALQTLMSPTKGENPATSSESSAMLQHLFTLHQQMKTWGSDCLLFIKQDIDMRCYACISRVALEAMDVSDENGLTEKVVHPNTTSSVLPSIHALNMDLTNVAHSLAFILSPHDYALVFAGLDILLPKLMMGLLNQMTGRTLSFPGVEQMKISLMSMKQNLTFLFYGQKQRWKLQGFVEFDRAQTFFMLLLLSDDELLDFVDRHANLFTVNEFQASWKVSTPLRKPTKESLAWLEKKRLLALERDK